MATFGSHKNLLRAPDCDQHMGRISTLSCTSIGDGAFEIVFTKPFVAPGGSDLQVKSLRLILIQSAFHCDRI